jgi:thiol-disulfide isomerase/thioredoxin
MTPLDAAGLRREIAARRGKVVVVNLWATWCGPCVEEFPDLVRVAQANRARGLELITLSFDDAADIKGKVAPLLARHGLTQGAFINRGGSRIDEAYIAYLEPKLPADTAFALPRTYVFDRRGKLITSLTGGQSRAAFEKAILPVLR